MAATRRLVALVVVLGLGVLAPKGASAAGGDVFTVAGVAVDVTASDAESAREQARIGGQRMALERLLKRIVPAVHYDRLPKPEDAAITDLVEGFEVADERVAPNRYIASLTFHFKPADVGALLRDHRVPYALTRSRPLLVLPLFRTREALLLWDDSNPWRLAWLGLPPADGLIEVIVPLGELADITLIDAAQAAAGERALLKRLAERYGAGEVAVVEAVVDRDSLVDTPTVRVALKRYRDEGVRIGGGTYSGMAWDTLESVLAVAARATRSQIEEEWKEANLLRFDQEESIAVDISFKDLGEWLDIRRRLSGLALVRNFEIAALSPRFARVVVHYLGDSRQLSGALANRDLDLSKEADLWILRLRGSKGGGDTAGTTPADPGVSTTE
ncbi:MAG: DUF2066 domain-containing protein [Alphaproteobacteria bacterium]